MHKWPLFLFLSLSMLACSTVTRLLYKPPEGDLEAEEQAVYSVLLEQHHGKTVVLGSNTDSGLNFGDESESTTYVQQGMPALSQNTWQNYLERNDRAYPLSADMKIGVDYMLISEEEFAAIFNTGGGDGWFEFYRRHPDSPGITYISRAGFNEDLTEALVYTGNMVGPLAGMGSLIRLEKQDGAWKIMDELMLWIS